jgi:hypothetical protein
MRRQKKTILQEAEQIWTNFQATGNTKINWNAGLSELNDLRWAYRNRKGKAKGLSCDFFENSLSLMKNYLQVV